jgi:methylmalonyl-CoA mutase cobalamin-binding subunit
MFRELSLAMHSTSATQVLTCFVSLGNRIMTHNIISTPEMIVRAQLN